jgi:hypothetical protein
VTKSIPLPKAAPARCPSCAATLPEAAIKPYSAMPTKLRTTAFGCLAKCPKCEIRLTGVRSFVRVFAGNYKFVRQSFQPITPESLAELQALQEYLTMGEQGGDTHLRDLGDNPELVVWFEDTRATPERALPSLPTAGLPETALPSHSGITLVESRFIEPGVLSGVRFIADSPTSALAYAGALRRAARHVGSAAYARSYDQPEFTVRWDTGGPAFGLPAALEAAA